MCGSVIGGFDASSALRSLPVISFGSMRRRNARPSERLNISGAAPSPRVVMAGEVAGGCAGG